MPVRHDGPTGRIGFSEVMKMGKAIRKALLAVGLLALMAGLLRHSGPVGEAVRQGIALCGRSVIPSLFPFFVTVSFAVACGFFSFLRQLRLPLNAAVFLLGAVGGYPVGGRTVGELYRGGMISRRQAEALLLCCNNAGPSFILSIAGAGVFGSQRVGWALYGIHLLAALAAGGLLGAFGERATGGNSGGKRPFIPPITGGNAPFLPAVFVTVTRNAALTMLNVCAFVIFFLALAALLRQLWPGLPPLAMGLLELTGGVTALKNDAAGFCMAAALLGWGGVSVHCQTAAVLEETELSLGRYLLAKALQAVVSALLALAVCRFLF